MKKLSLLFLLAVLLNLGVEGAAQTAQPSAVVPCESETPSRPTLRRRHTKPEDQPTAEQQRDLTSNPCDNSGVASDGIVSRKPVTVRFEGLIAVSEEDFRRRLRDRRLNQSLDSATDSASLANAETLLKNLLGDYGHRQAEVSSRLEQAGSESPVVTFLISEGPRFTISEIRFEGNRVFSQEMLATKIKECLAKHDEERQPRVYRSDAFEYCTRLLANFERWQGYLQAKFAEPRIEEAGDRLIITISADEGVLYRLGNLEIEGADHVAEADIRKLLDMRTGDVANGEKLSKAFFEDLKVIYGEKGFIQYTAEIQPEFRTATGNSAGVVDFRITVDEGRRFKIWKLAFEGEDLPENELRQMLLLREGKVYNQKLFEQSVTRINETGSFNWVDKDKDVDYRTNEEEGLLSIVIKVTRRSPPM